MHPYEKLQVWHKAHALAVTVRHTAGACRAKDLADQLRRASASVPTNIVEGAGSQSSAMFLRYLHIAIASAQETEYLLRLLRDIGDLAESRHAELHAACTEVQRMLCGLVGAMGRRAEATGRNSSRQLP